MTKKQIGELSKQYDKLKELEDVEEIIGISINILFKALLHGIWWDEGFVPPNRLAINNCRICILHRSVELPFKGPVGYGKSWALTKEELINGGRRE